MLALSLSLRSSFVFPHRFCSSYSADLAAVLPCLRRHRVLLLCTVSLPFRRFPSHRRSTFIRIECAVCGGFETPSLLFAVVLARFRL